MPEQEREFSCTPAKAQPCLWGPAALGSALLSPPAPPAADFLQDFQEILRIHEKKMILYSMHLCTKSKPVALMAPGAGGLHPHPPSSAAPPALPESRASEGFGGLLAGLRWPQDSVFSRAPARGRWRPSSTGDGGAGGRRGQRGGAQGSAGATHGSARAAQGQRRAAQGPRRAA